MVCVQNGQDCTEKSAAMACIKDEQRRLVEESQRRLS
jgi:hypothetical protein